eukprot:scaffold853_cov386-Prasinococcus_capsulatus_cf.AAC.14
MRYRPSLPSQVLAGAVPEPDFVAEPLMWNAPFVSQGAIALAGVVKQSTRITSLKLARNLIGGKGIRAISDALDINRTVLELDIRKNKAGVIGAKAIRDTLQANNVLEKLLVRCNNLGNKGAAYIGPFSMIPTARQNCLTACARLTIWDACLLHLDAAVQPRAYKRTRHLS